MKLARALKEKNRLVGEVNRIKAIIIRDNSLELKRVGNKDREQQWIDYRDAVVKLVEIKTAIFKANAGIYETIVCMSEKKAELAWITDLNTQDGVEEIQNFSNDNVVKKEYSAYLKQSDIDSYIVSLQKDIADLQDELDEFNAKTEITVESHNI